MIMKGKSSRNAVVLVSVAVAAEAGTIHDVARARLPTNVFEAAATTTGISAATAVVHHRRRHHHRLQYSRHRRLMARRKAKGRWAGSSRNEDTRQGVELQVCRVVGEAVLRVLEGHSVDSEMRRSLYGTSVAESSIYL